MWKWLDFNLDQGQAAPVRGKDYRVIVTRDNGQPISFAYDTTNPYKDGCLSVGSTGTATGTCPTYLRLHDAVDSMADWNASSVLTDGSV